MKKPKIENLATFFDHTVLKPDTTIDKIEQLCVEAMEYGFKSVCVNPTWVKYCKKILKGGDVEVCTVIGFPLGANTTKTKLAEAENALADGATELDMVINIGKLKAGDNESVLKEIKKLKKLCGKDKVLKVIIETVLLTREEKEKVTRLIVESGADFVKTSTGFAGGGATVEDIYLLTEVAAGKIQVKASGGIKSLDFALQLIAAGADRIGSSGSVEIIREYLKTQ